VTKIVRKTPKPKVMISLIGMVSSFMEGVEFFTNKRMASEFSFPTLIELRHREMMPGDFAAPVLDSTLHEIGPNRR
jgi:hypothetical protein